jgi:hypothetical protein
MAVNKRYTAEGNKGAGREFPKLPVIRIKSVGDKFQGTLKEVSDRFTTEDTFGGVTKKVEKEVWTYTNVVVVNKTMNDDGEVTEEKTEYDEANFFYSKPAQFTAIGDSLEKAGLDDPKPGVIHRFKRITDGEAKQLKDGTMGSRPHRFLSEFVV